MSPIFRKCLMREIINVWSDRLCQFHRI